MDNIVLPSTKGELRTTPRPWTTTPGTFWVCTIGNNPDDPGIWSEYPVDDDMNFPYGEKEDDAALIVASVHAYDDLPEVLEAFTAMLNMVDGDGMPPNWDWLREVRDKIKSHLDVRISRSRP